MTKASASIFEHSHDIDTMGIAVYDTQNWDVRTQGVDQIEELECGEIGIPFPLEGCQSVVENASDLRLRSQ